MGKRDSVSTYKYRAERKGLVWELSDEMIDLLFCSDCWYCGRRASDTSFGRNGIDRIDSALGYTPDNVVSCCTVCNKMKMDLSKEVFVSQCIRIARRMGEDIPDVPDMVVEEARRKERASAQAIDACLDIISQRIAQRYA